MKAKHRNDKNHGKGGYCSGNPRYGKGSGAGKAQRQKDKTMVRKLIGG